MAAAFNEMASMKMDLLVIQKFDWVEQHEYNPY